MDEEKLVEHSAQAGEHLRRGLERLEQERPEHVSNARGRGLMCAIDLPDGATRDAVAQKMYQLGAVILGCGPRSLRFRPPLDVTLAELDEGLGLMRRAIDEATLKSA
jgi:L-lysine 6-transaminase